MILVTGGTGFIGGELVRQLTNVGLAYRLLLQPSKDNTNLPAGIDLNIALSSLQDERGVRAAMKDVDTVFHLAGVEHSGTKGNLLEVEVSAIEVLTRVAKDAGVQRIIYLSHLGANRASAFGLMKAKGIAESVILNSGLNYTILRSSMVYGTGDNFTLNLARLIRISPGLVLLPGDGSTLLQPLWVGDLVTGLTWALTSPKTMNQVLEIGGPEHLSFLEIMQTIAQKINRKPKFVEFSPAHLGILTQMLENRVKGFPTNVFWMDYLAENRTCTLDSMSLTFGINPVRFSKKLDYLQTTPKRKRKTK